MPLLLNIDELNGPELRIWSAGESTDELIKKSTEMGISVPESAETFLEKRKREWITTRLLLAQYSKHPELLFRSTGQPHLSDGRFISISHSKDLAGTVISDRPVGIDIQAADKKIYTIRKRFCNAFELNDALSAANELDYLTTIWSAKEAIFKCFGEHVHFSEDIRIKPFSNDDETIYADYNGIHGIFSFSLRRRKYDSFFILYTL